MIKSPLISIVVPIYNAEKYIEDCIRSIAQQTYTNIEVILVNDGSHDKSPEICKEWILENNDPRFRLVSKDNGGLSDARNFGIEHCSKESDFVIFVDSDDEILPECVSALVEYVSDDSLVIGQLIRCKKSNNLELKNDSNTVTVYSDIWRNSSLLERLQDGILNSCCANCYSLRVIKDNRLRFKKHLPEDTTFNIEYASAVSSIIVLDKALYLYYIWSDSMSTKPKEEIYDNYMILQQALYSKVPKSDHKYINRFVYPQYRVNTVNYIKAGDYATPRKYFANDLIHRAFKSYRPVSIADRFIHECLRNRLFRLVALFFNYGKAR